MALSWQFFAFDAHRETHHRYRNGFRVLRVLLLRALVLCGHNVISLDLDAQLREPCPILS